MGQLEWLYAHWSHVSSLDASILFAWDNRRAGLVGRIEHLSSKITSREFPNPSRCPRWRHFDMEEERNSTGWTFTVDAGFHTLDQL
jgi:hypothetical protein